MYRCNECFQSGNINPELKYYIEGLSSKLESIRSLNASIIKLQNDLESFTTLKNDVEKITKTDIPNI